MLPRHLYHTSLMCLYASGCGCEREPYKLASDFQPTSFITDGVKVLVSIYITSGVYT